MNYNIDDIEAVFSETGGEFITPAAKITEKLKTIKAYLFDCD